VFTFNGRSQDSTAIDPPNGTVLGTIKLDGKPESPPATARARFREHRRQERIDRD